jgi:predicted transcriptional regulator
MRRAIGRPQGIVSLAALAVLQQGISGDFNQIAAHACLPPSQVSMALRNLRRYGAVAAQESSKRRGGQGRPPVVYTLARHPDTPAFDALAFLRQHWR